MILVGPSAGRIGQKALLLLVEVIGRIYRFREITMLVSPWVFGMCSRGVICRVEGAERVEVVEAVEGGSGGSGGRQWRQWREAVETVETVGGKWCGAGLVVAQG